MVGYRAKELLKLGRRKKRRGDGCDVDACIGVCFQMAGMVKVLLLVPGSSSRSLFPGVNSCKRSIDPRHPVLVKRAAIETD